jgi:hypothetical protein
MESRNGPFQDQDIRMRLVSSKSSDEQSRHLSWLCLGDVRPHFVKLKGDCDWNHVITDDSDDFTSDDEDCCALETKSYECRDSSIQESSEETETSQSFIRKQGPDESIFIDQGVSGPSSDWSLDVSTILAQHLVDYHRLAQDSEITHVVAINMSEEMIPLIPTCTYNPFVTNQDTGHFNHPGDNVSLQVTDKPLLSCKKRRMDPESHCNTIDRFPSETKRRSVVTLHSKVSVIPIPARDEYSPRARESMWSSFTEMARNIARNSIEFASEGWNWRSVIEDDDMLVHDVSGELIHPIHIQNALALIGAHEDLFVPNPFNLNGETTVNNVPLVLPPNID